ncbi:MAG: septal ring lytic transglycosylase RlpA family protein [Candidatus Aminicenantes bacterium]|nr:septal ring lytic transglycosylase RlpA family protein [Candidatus Aminicenantes bacterium]
MSNIQVKKLRLLSVLCSVILLSSCAGKSYFHSGNVQKGLASWYGPDFHGKLTSNKEIYNMHALTAAHKTLPFGTYVRVTNLNNGKSIIVRINDRGPFVKGRIIDLSYAAAKKLGMDITGVAPVKIKVLKKYSPKKSSQKFSVQVGSFSSKKNAKALKKKLQKNHRNVYISKVKTSSDTFYRVRIKARSVKSAENIVKKLMKQGYQANILEEH